jgi:hypothetical protein
MISLFTSLPQAATLTVTNSLDSGPGSLRDAVALASAGDEIVFDAQLAGTHIVLTSGQISIEKNMAITGLGQDLTILDGNHASRIFEIVSPAVVTLSGMTIQNGFEQHIVHGQYDEGVIAEGGGIYNSGTLTLNDSSVRGCQITSRVCEDWCRFLWDGSSVKGGGIFNSGVLLINRGSVEQNDAENDPSYGGGIYNTGYVTLDGTWIASNEGYFDRAHGLFGVGLYNSSSGTMIVNDGVVTGNTRGATPAIQNEGALSMTRTTIAGNGYWRGGGILNFGAAELTECSLFANWTGAGGQNSGYAGGITNMGSMTLTRTAVSGNWGEGTAAIANRGRGDATLRVINSTIVNNEAYMGGGGLDNFLTSVIIGSTISGNYGWGGGLRSNHTVVKNSILSGNTNREPELEDCEGSVVSLGHNILGNGPNCFGFGDGEGDMIDADWAAVFENNGLSFGRPQLVLADNGGPTYTVALLPDGPAVDAIPMEACTDDGDRPITTDQRGVVRPQGDACDAGAFEFSEPRGEGFWAHQCDGKGYTQVEPDKMQSMFDSINETSGVFPELAPSACDFIRPQDPRSDLKTRTEQELLCTWLNLSSGRLTRGRPIDLPDLTEATTAGEALSEIESTVSEPQASRSALGKALKLAEALNGKEEDMELAAAESALTLPPGATGSITLGLINMSSGNRNYRISVSGPWPAQLSTTRVEALGSGQVKEIAVTFTAPRDARATGAQFRITAVDQLSQEALSREVTLRVRISGASDPPQSTVKPKLLH